MRETKFKDCRRALSGKKISADTFVITDSHCLSDFAKPLKLVCSGLELQVPSRKILPLQFLINILVAFRLDGPGFGVAGHGLLFVPWSIPSRLWLNWGGCFSRSHLLKLHAMLYWYIPSSSSAAPYRKPSDMEAYSTWWLRRSQYIPFSLVSCGFQPVRCVSAIRYLCASQECAEMVGVKQERMVGYPEVKAGRPFIRSPALNI